MITDIHTHNKKADPQHCVINLTLSEAEALLKTSVAGKYSIGIHPWEAHKNIDWQLLSTLAIDTRIFAIGECGLDKNATADMETQIMVFRRQIELAQQLQKPLIIHCVKCYNELIKIKKAYPATDTQMWIIHGFRGKPQLATQLIQDGFFLSFGKKFNPESWNITPPERRFCETDTDTNE